MTGLDTFFDGCKVYCRSMYLFFGVIKLCKGLKNQWINFFIIFLKSFFVRLIPNIICFV